MDVSTWKFREKYINICKLGGYLFGIIQNNFPYILYTAKEYFLLIM
jgi:hypothetical protein